jgi:hypothetical protein
VSCHPIASLSELDKQMLILILIYFGPEISEVWSAVTLAWYWHHSRDLLWQKQQWSLYNDHNCHFLVLSYMFLSLSAVSHSLYTCTYVSCLLVGYFISHEPHTGIEKIWKTMLNVITERVIKYETRERWCLIWGSKSGDEYCFLRCDAIRV